MPQHMHTVSLDDMLSQTERLLVRWLLQELNAIRTELGMAEVTTAGLLRLRREDRERERQQRAAQEGQP